RIAVGLPDRRRLSGHRGLCVVRFLPVVPAAGFDGQNVMRRLLWPLVTLALVIAYPLLFSTPFQQRLGALVLLYAIAASAWNIIGGYAGQISVAAPTPRWAPMRISACRHWWASPRASCLPW